MRVSVAGKVGVGAALTTAACYAPGMGRAYGWDASNTVAHFVATPSLLDPFRRQVGYNNHVLFSAMEHIVYSVTGSRDERVMRVLPIAFAMVAVGLVAWEATRRLGALAGVVAAAIIIANPLAVQEFREPRAYSLVVLCAVVTSGLLIRLVVAEGRRSMVIAYVAFAAVGVASHLYMLTVLVAHAAYVSDGKGALRRWAPRWLVAIVAGLGVAAVPIGKEVFRHQYRFFDAVFPLRFTFDLVAGESVAFVLLAPLAAVGAWRLRHRVPLRRAAIAVAAMVLGSWVASPEFIYSRFYLWLLPAVAVVVASVVARRRVLVWVVAVALGAQVLTQLPSLGEAEVPNRTAGALVTRAQRGGARTCAVGSTGTTLSAYATGYATVHHPAELASCDLVVDAEGGFNRPLVAAAARRFRYHRRLPAKKPGAAFSSRKDLLVYAGA
jgi:hypothetical protein